MWETASLPPLDQNFFLVRRAQVAEKEKALQVALLSLNMSTEWHDGAETVAAFIEKTAQRAFAENQEASCLVATHGGRIIGVSLLDCDLEASFHLVSGPWVLMEYRNRGIGSLLLHASLQELAERGVTEARGKTRANGIAARFVYPKFGGVQI